MASAVIGALRVNLSIDTGAFSRGLKDAEGRLGAFGKAVGPAVLKIAAIGAAAAAAGASLVAGLVAKAMPVIDAQAKLAKRLDASVAAIQALQHAGNLAGVSNEELTKGMEMLNARLGEVARTGKGPAHEALQRLGLDARELSAMDADGRIKALADRMAELGYTTQQQADTLRQFGIRSQAMINLFQEGSAAIDAARRDLDAWGVSLSDIDAAKVEAAGDAMARIGVVIDGVANQLAVQLAPYIEAAAQAFTDAAKEAGGFGAAIHGAVQAAGSSIGWLADRIHQIGFLFATIDATLAALSLKWEQTFGSTESASAAVERWKESYAGFRELADAELPSVAIDAWMKKAEEAAATAAKMRLMFDTAFDPGKGEGGDTGETEAEAAARERQQEELNRRLEALRGALMTEREAELAAYETRLADLKEFHDKRLITDQEYADLRVQVEADYIQKIKDLNADAAKVKAKAVADQKKNQEMVADSVMSTLNSLFGENKNVAIALALINTAEAVTKTLAVHGWTPVGVAGAAAAAAAGYAQIAAIRSTNRSGGGSPAPVSGGGSTAVGQASGGAAVGAQQTLYIRGLDQGSMFSAESVRELATKLIDFQRDGGRVVLK